MLMLGCFAVIQLVVLLLILWFPRECTKEDVNIEIKFIQIMYLMFLLLMFILICFTVGFDMYLVINSRILKFILILLIPSVLPCYISYELTKREIVKGKKAVFLLYLPLLVQYSIYIAFCLTSNLIYL